MSRLIVTHGDVDGILSAAILARALGGSFDYSFSGPSSLDRTLSKLRARGSELFILDIGLNRSKLAEVESSLRRLSSEGLRVLWYDHHHWDSEALSRIASLVELKVKPSTSNARLVFEDLGGGEFEEELVRIADDADTGSYSMEISRLYNAISMNRRMGRKLLERLVSGSLMDEELRSFGEAKLRELEDQVSEGLRRAVVRITRGGRRFCVIDLRRRGPGSLIARRATKELGVDFSLVFSCRRFSLYAGVSRELDLRRVCEVFGGGGHPYACGGRLDLNPIKRIVCKLLPRFYTPSEVRELLRVVEETF
ncbi:MAG: hypothetical protein QXJ39_04865 [Candidatus Korarchaeum sp.]